MMKKEKSPVIKLAYLCTALTALSFVSGFEAMAGVPVPSFSANQGEGAATDLENKLSETTAETADPNAAAAKQQTWSQWFWSWIYPTPKTPTKSTPSEGEVSQLSGSSSGGRRSASYTSQGKVKYTIKATEKQMQAIDLGSSNLSLGQ